MERGEPDPANRSNCTQKEGEAVAYANLMFTQDHTAPQTASQEYYSRCRTLPPSGSGSQLEDSYGTIMGEVWLDIERIAH